MRRNYQLLVLLFPIVFWFVCFFVLPLVSVFIYSFLERGTYGGVRWNWTLENYGRLFDGLYLGILWRSVSTAFVCTAVCLLLGYPFAYYLARYRPRHRNILLLLVVVPFWTNFLIRTYAWILILRHRRTFEQSFGGCVPELGTVGVTEHAARGADRSRLWIPTVYDTSTLCSIGTIGYVAVGSGTGFRCVATPRFLACDGAAQSSRHPRWLNAGFYPDSRCIFDTRPPRWREGELYW